MAGDGQVTMGEGVVKHTAKKIRRLYQDKILAGVARNRFLIYTSPDIRALYAFKRVAWWPYSVAMRQANVVFSRALRSGLK
jgi:hypothetical protein